MDGGPCLCRCAVAGRGSAVAVELQGIPDPAEARELQSRRGDGEADAEAVARQERSGALVASSHGSWPPVPRLCGFLYCRLRLMPPGPENSSQRMVLGNNSSDRMPPSSLT